MIRNLRLFGLLLCLLFLPCKSFAQFQNHFSTYTTQSLESDGITIEQTYTIEGYTVIQIPPGMRPGAVHTPHVYNTVGSTGGWTQGSSSCPTCYINFGSTVSHQQIGNITEQSNTEGEIICTVAGEFFFDPPIIYDIHIGITNFTFSDADSANCYYVQSCPNGNNNASCPAPVGGLVIVGGQSDDPPCSQFAYAATYHLVVNLHCFPVGVTSLHTYAVNCQ